MAPLMDTIKAICTPPTKAELISIGMMKPWKNSEIKAIALRVARNNPDQLDALAFYQQKWAIVDALHELDGRTTTAPKGDPCPKPKDV